MPAARPCRAAHRHTVTTSRVLAGGDLRHRHAIGTLWIVLTSRHRTRWTTALLAAAVIVGGCGTGEPGDSAGAPTTPWRATPPTAAAEPTTRPPGIDEAATVTTPADRVDEAVHITWIGGSDIDLDGRSIPDAVMARAPMIDERPIVVVADTKIAPLPAEVEARVEQAAARNVDGLVVILNPSWLSWDGHEECSGIAPAHDYYACVLEPLPDTDVEALSDDVRSLVDAVVATGLPAYLYVIPHSAESLTHPELGRRLAATEQQFAELDPALDRIEYIGHIASRDLDPLHEGTEFNDMVHPSEIGVERLAEHFAAEFVRFFGPLVADR